MTLKKGWKDLLVAPNALSLVSRPLSRVQEVCPLYEADEGACYITSTIRIPSLGPNVCIILTRSLNKTQHDPTRVQPVEPMSLLGLFTEQRGGVS